MRRPYRCAVPRVLVESEFVTSHRSIVPNFLRGLGFALAAAGALLAGSPAAWAKAGIRDAEIEKILRGYSDPIFRAGGLDEKAVEVYIINDPTLNAFVAGGQNVFINTGMIMTFDTPNELKGVIAHETGHITGGHLARGPEAMAKAEVPMLITMLAGVAAIAAGQRRQNQKAQIVCNHLQQVEQINLVVVLRIALVGAQIGV